jgi:class 3 adenylate cyclase
MSRPITGQGRKSGQTGRARVPPAKTVRTKDKVERNFFYLEDLLYKVVFEANELVSGDGCSIFLWDKELGRFVLRESTIMTPFIGKYSLDHTKDPRKARVGITTLAAIRGETYLSTDVRKDSNWSFGKAIKKRVLPETRKSEHCEAEHSDLLSLIVVPIKNLAGEMRGVLRVIRKRDKQGFGREDQKKIESFVDSYAKDILGALSLGKLIEMGSVLNLEALCQQAVNLLKLLVNGRGCSIFLLDEQKSTADRYIYRCTATTGLEAKDEAGNYVQITDPGEAVYTIPEDVELGRITAYMISNKRNLVIKDLHTCDFEKEFGRKRSVGLGKYSEGHSKKGVRTETGPSMSTPLFFRERFDPETPAMGCIRLTRPRNDPPFQSDEQRRFFAFAEKFAKTILQLRYIQLLNDLSAASAESDMDEQFRRVVTEVPKLIGGKGCSLFVGHPTLKMRATSGRLEQKLKLGQIQSYDPSNEQQRGFTGAVAFHKEPIRFNNKEEMAAYAKRGIKNSNRDECETEAPSKFLAVPIIGGDRAEGVIRVPKTAEESPFSSDDQNMLMSIAGHLGQIIQTTKANFLNRYFGHDPRIRDAVVDNPSILNIKKRLLTICFWDIRGYTSMCHWLSENPQLITGFIAEYYDLAEQVVFDHGGTLDKFVGDGVMAFFGFAKTNDAEAAIAAVRAAEELKVRFDDLANKHKDYWRSKIARKIEASLGCGIHTGKVPVGLVGSGFRKQFTALGEHVNLAARICGRAGSNGVGRGRRGSGGGSSSGGGRSQTLISGTTEARVADHFKLAYKATIDDFKNLIGDFDLFEVLGPK